MLILWLKPLELQLLSQLISKFKQMVKIFVFWIQLFELDRKCSLMDIDQMSILTIVDEFALQINVLSLITAIKDHFIVKMFLQSTQRLNLQLLHDIASLLRSTARLESVQTA